MQYNLVMRVNNNNYQPFDFNMLESYENENLSSLEGIDNFTSKYKEELELKYDLYRANFINIEDANNDLKIIFYENGSNREYKYGLVFEEAKEFTSSDRIIEFLNSNIDDYLTLNKIYNEFNKRKNKSTFLVAVLDVLKSVKKCNDVKNIYYIKFLPYEERRSLGMYIYNTFYDILYTDKNKKECDNNEIRRTRSKEEKRVSN